MKPLLEADLERELDQIRQDPIEAVGFGEKAYIPYHTNVGDGLIGSDDPSVTTRLLAEVRGPGDRTYRLAVLHVLGRRTDAGVDAALIAALDDPDLRATSAYLLGRPGFKGYPARPRDLDVVRAALRRYLDDKGSFEDPFYRKRFRTQDFVLAAFVRLTGLERFQLDAPELIELIGYTLPSFSSTVRDQLLRQAKRVD